MKRKGNAREKMKQILLAPDSFKGTLSAREVCEIETRAIHEVFPDAHITALPMADGGEGMTEACLAAFDGEKVKCTVHGPNGKMTEAFYAMLADGSAAIEMAAAAGLPLMCGKLDPLHASTYGVGELLADAKRRGAKRFLLGLGGSATNDCGIGMAAALGWRFLDRHGRDLPPLAQNLGKVENLVPPRKAFAIPVSAACDVDNPLLGEQGATFVFGPQKGVTEDIKLQMEADMAHFALVLKRVFPSFDSNTPGSGAAGGMGSAVMTFLGGTLCPGIELLLDAAGFDEKASKVDLVVTGEGCMDAQSLHGKVPSGVGKRAKRAGKPCIAVCGALGKGAEKLSDMGITAMYAATNEKRTLKELQKTCCEDLYRITVQAMRELKEN